MFYLKRLDKRLKKFYYNSILKLKYFWLTKVVIKLPFARRSLYVRQFIKFLSIGSISTLIDFLIYISLTRFFAFGQTHYLWANFMAMVIASTVNFSLNKKWTFTGGKKKALHQCISFYIVLVVGLFLYQFLFGFFVKTFGWHDIVAKAITAFVIMLIRFHLHKFWVFK